MTCHRGDNRDNRGWRLLLHAKEIEPSRGIRNKGGAEFSTACDHSAGVCLFVKQQYRRLAHSCPGKYRDAKYRNERGPGFRQGLSITARVMPGIHPNRMSFLKAPPPASEGRTAAVPAFNIAARPRCEASNAALDLYSVATLRVLASRSCSLHSAAASVSPVRMRTACSSPKTKILPSPICWLKRRLKRLPP